MSRATPMMPTAAPITTARPENPHSAILIADSDNALFSLIEEWLVACGYKALRNTDDGSSSGTLQAVDMVILDLPFPRQEMPEAVRRISLQYPGVPILAVSSTFFPGVASHGTVARSLGVSAVVAKPLKRDLFIEAVTKLLRPRA